MYRIDYTDGSGISGGCHQTKDAAIEAVKARYPHAYADDNGEHVMVWATEAEHDDGYTSVAEIIDDGMPDIYSRLRKKEEQCR